MAELGSTNIYGDLDVKNNKIKQVAQINDISDIELAHLKGTTSAIQTQLNGKVDDGQVLTNVPANAKFTDTLTTINGKTGVIVKADITALGIPAQDTVYTHPSTHSADIITDGTTNKVYTATEKNKIVRNCNRR